MCKQSVCKCPCQRKTYAELLIINAETPCDENPVSHIRETGVLNLVESTAKRDGLSVKTVASVRTCHVLDVRPPRGFKTSWLVEVAAYCVVSDADMAGRPSDQRPIPRWYRAITAVTTHTWSLQRPRAALLAVY